MLRFLWRATRGYRLRPWASPYLRWRVETYWGIPANELDGAAMRRFAWEHRSDLLRFVRWAARMDHAVRQRA
ncbi:MAG: hypothetical protein NTY38_11660 [Acidobacteria bacterium]|nr:hypothetical protein [Acidobacteriota bacterium]